MSHVNHRKMGSRPLPAMTRDLLRILMRRGMPDWMAAAFESQFAGKPSISFGAPIEGSVPARRDRIAFSVEHPHVVIDCDFTIEDFERLYREFIEEAELDEDAEGILPVLADELVKACDWARSMERTDIQYAMECAAVFLILKLQHHGVPIDDRIAGCTVMVPAPETREPILVSLTKSGWAMPNPTVR